MLNTLFVNIKDFSKENKYLSSINKMCHYVINKYCDTANLCYILTIDINYNEEVNSKSRFSKLLKHFFILKLKKYFKNIDCLNIIFSKELEIKKYEKYKNYILAIIGEICDIDINYIEPKNNMLIHDMKYISEYLIKNNISIDKANLLVLLGYINSIVEEKIVEYITNYKFLDIFVEDCISDFEYSKIKNFIEKINNEYGTTIDIVKGNDLKDYNVCISFLDKSKFEIISKYVFSRNFKYIDINNEEFDYLDKNVATYIKYENEIKIWFDKMDINVNEFNKNSIGQLYNILKT